MRRNALGLVLLSVILCQTGHVWALTWEKTFGTSGQDWAIQVMEADDHGFILLGMTSSSMISNGDICLIKTDKNGNFEWKKTYGDQNREDSAGSVQKTSDGGYIIAANSIDTSTWTGFAMLYKVDPQGQLQWSKSYSNGDYATCAYQTSDGGYIVSGIESTHQYIPDENLLLIKTDASGNTEWRKILGSVGWGGESWVRQAGDEGFIISSGNDQDDFLLVKTFSDGSLNWSKSFGFPNTVERADQLEILEDGGFIISGSSFSSSFPQGTVSIYLVRTDSAGNKLWDKLIPTDCDDPDMSATIQKTSDGGFIVSGGTASPSTSIDAYIVKTDSLGNVDWTKSFGGSDYDLAESVRQTSDGGYIVGGYTYSYGAGDADFYLIYYNPLLKAGDFDRDGDVDGSDLSAFISDPKGVSLFDFASSFGT